MMKTKSYVIFVVLFILSIKLQAQSGNLSSSPYSLYGLGLLNTKNPGNSNSLGQSGIAMPFYNSINNLNPAAFATIKRNNFMLDVGFILQYEDLYEKGIKEQKITGNFSNFAIAFPLSKKSGIGFTLIPFSNVGYSIIGIESYIEGSTNNTYKSNITGSGGLNDLKLNYGYSITKNFRIGVAGSVLFGSIKEEETTFLGESNLIISENNYYNGLRLGLGLQYSFGDFLTIGNTINFPTSLNGKKENQVVLGTNIIDETEDDIKNFKLPLEVGIGLHSSLNNKLLFNLDYKHQFWDTTNQSDNVGDFVDSNEVNFGTQFTPKKNSNNYWQRVNYNFGVSYNDGYLSVLNQKVERYEFNLGLGLPISNRNKSILHINYSYGQQGKISNKLIKENYHTLSINIGLNDRWFQEKKIF